MRCAVEDAKAHRVQDPWIETKIIGAGFRFARLTVLA